MPPVTTRFATSAPDRRPGSDRRHARRAAPEPSQAERRAWRIAPGAAFAPVRAFRKGHSFRAIGGGSGGRGPSATRKGSVRTSRSRPHGRRLASLRSQRSFVPPVSIEPGVFGLARRRGDARRSPPGRAHANAARSRLPLHPRGVRLSGPRRPARSTATRVTGEGMPASQRTRREVCRRPVPGRPALMAPPVRPRGSRRRVR